MTRSVSALFRLVALVSVCWANSAAAFRAVSPAWRPVEGGRLTLDGAETSRVSSSSSSSSAVSTASVGAAREARASEGLRATFAETSAEREKHSAEQADLPSAREVSLSSPSAVVAPLSCSASGVDFEKIKKLLPHRFPFLLVDRVLCATPQKALGLKLVTANEDFFNGHFPERAVMPGVLQVEALAQLSGVVAMQILPSKETSRLFFFGGVDGVKWKKPVVPGDVLVMETELISLRENLGIAKFAGRGYVDGKLCVEVKEMTFAFENEAPGLCLSAVSAEQHAAWCLDSQGYHVLLPYIVIIVFHFTNVTLKEISISLFTFCKCSLPELFPVER